MKHASFDWFQVVQTVSAKQTGETKQEASTKQPAAKSLKFLTSVCIPCLQTHLTYMCEGFPGAKSKSAV